MAKPQITTQTPNPPSREALLKALKWLMSLPPEPAPQERSQDR